MKRKRLITNAYKHSNGKRASPANFFDKPNPTLYGNKKGVVEEVLFEPHFMLLYQYNLVLCSTEVYLNSLSV